MNHAAMRLMTLNNAGDRAVRAAAADQEQEQDETVDPARSEHVMCVVGAAGMEVAGISQGSVI